MSVSSGGFGDGGTGDAGALNVLDGVHDQLLLLFRAKIDHVGDGIEVGNEGEHHAGEFMELLDKKDLGELVDRDAADIFRKAHVHEPGLAVGHCCFHAEHDDRLRRLASPLRR